MRLRSRYGCSITVLAACCAALPGSAAAGDKWPEEASAGLFACHADFDLAPHAGLLAELKLLERDVREQLGTPEAEESVHLFLFEKKATYQAYLDHYFPRVPQRRALYIKGRGPGMVFAYQGLDFEIDVRHECTHAVLHASLDHVPLWLDEGLAEYFEMPRDKRATGHPHAAQVAALHLRGRMPRLSELEAIDDLAAMGREEYRDAWAWVHFLLHGPPEARQELAAFLQDIQSGRAGELLSRRLSRRLPNFHRLAEVHFRSLDAQ